MPHSSAMQTTEQRCNAPQKGGLAQLGEHLLCKQGVVGSIPSSSTKTHEEPGVALEGIPALVLASYEARCFVL